jgi:hypothetical protein
MEAQVLTFFTLQGQCSSCGAIPCWGTITGLREKQLIVNPGIQVNEEGQKSV